MWLRPKKSFGSGIHQVIHLAGEIKFLIGKALMSFDMMKGEVAPQFVAELPDCAEEIILRSCSTRAL